MVQPTQRLALLLLAAAPLMMLVRHPAFLLLALIYDLGLVLVVVLDLWLSGGPDQWSVSRIVPEQLSLGDWNSVGWEVVNRGSQTLKLELTDDVPEEFEKDTPGVRGRMRARAHDRLLYGLRPTKRGLYELGDVHLRYRSLLGLTWRHQRFPTRTAVKVYPNVANLVRYELASRRHRLRDLGVVSVRQRGQGTMFESLREYVPGDNPTDIAWKATAHRDRMIVRNFETERSQNILLVLDCGRLMTTEVDRLSRLDHAINASLLLTYVAMKQGDYVGLLAFSDEVHGYVPPVRGRAALSRMNEALYRLEPRLREPNYEQACRFLALRHRKRSLIVVFTDVLDRNASAMLLAYMARFARNHLPLCVTLRNLDVEHAAGQQPQTAPDCYSKFVALGLLDRRAEALGWMRRSGVNVLDADPRELTPRLIDRYLLLKSRLRF